MVAMKDTHITMAHGGGGIAMHALIEEVFLEAFSSTGKKGVQEDQARIVLADLVAKGDRVALTTDSFVVDPLEFPGGNIGTLAVCGTINDLAVGGAQPVALSAAFIISEGFERIRLQRIVASMAETAQQAGVSIITGDTKVVPRSACDGLFITTTGIGTIQPAYHISIAAGQPKDVLLVNGTIGDHGATILCARGDLALETSLRSDCAALHGLMATVLDAVPEVHCARDATRGGLAAVLHELAEASGVCVCLEENAVPVKSDVMGLCDILGLDPLYMANEGKLVLAVPPKYAQQALAAMKAHPLGRDAAIIGQLEAAPNGKGSVHLINSLGHARLMTLPSGEPLPRIC